MWGNDDEETEAALDALRKGNATRNAGKAETLPYMRQPARRPRREVARASDMQKTS